MVFIELSFLRQQPLSAYFGKKVNVFLELNIKPLFAPPREPRTMGSIENFNSQTQRPPLNRDSLADFA